MRWIGCFIAATMVAGMLSGGGATAGATSIASGRPLGGLLWTSAPPDTGRVTSACDDPAWSRSDFTVKGRTALQQITLNVSGLPVGVDRSGFSSAVGAAATTWNQERNPCGRGDRSSFAFRVAQTVGTTPLPADDGYHMVMFSSGVCESLAHVACLFAHEDPATGADRGWDVVLDPSYPWGIGPGPWLDVQNVLTHELGHAVGLADLGLASGGGCSAEHALLTMYGCTWPGDVQKRDLGAGDALGVEAISSA